VARRPRPAARAPGSAAATCPSPGRRWCAATRTACTQHPLLRVKGVRAGWPAGPGGLGCRPGPGSWCRRRIQLEIPRSVASMMSTHSISWAWLLAHQGSGGHTAQRSVVLETPGVDRADRDDTNGGVCSDSGVVVHFVPGMCHGRATPVTGPASSIFPAGCGARQLEYDTLNRVPFPKAGREFDPPQGGLHGVRSGISGHLRHASAHDRGRAPGAARARHRSGARVPRVQSR
jgi:hypothetical protein